MEKQNYRGIPGADIVRYKILVGKARKELEEEKEKQEAGMSGIEKFSLFVEKQKKLREKRECDSGDIKKKKVMISKKDQKERLLLKNGQKIF